MSFRSRSSSVQKPTTFLLSIDWLIDTFCKGSSLGQKYKGVFKENLLISVEKRGIHSILVSMQKMKMKLKMWWVIDIEMNKCKNKCMNKWINEWMNEWMFSNLWQCLSLYLCEDDLQPSEFPQLVCCDQGNEGRRYLHRLSSCWPEKNSTVPQHLQTSILDLSKEEKWFLLHSVLEKRVKV